MDEVKDLLSQKALEELHGAYTKNYIAHTVIMKTNEWLIEAAKKWFTDNGYKDPDEELAKNDDFLERADHDEKQAEIVKTQYTTHWTELNELRWANIKSKAEQEASVEWLKLVLSLLNTNQ